MQEVKFLEAEHLVRASLGQRAHPPQHLCEDRELSGLARQDLQVLVRLGGPGEFSAVEEEDALEGLAGQAGVEHVSAGNGLLLGLEMAGDHQQVAVVDVEFIEEQAMRLTQVLN